jgi:hypothetical protein
MSELMSLDTPSYRFGWPAMDAPAGHLPRAAERLATIRWDWGPDHGRTDDYYLVQADDCWQLWLVDPNCAASTTLVVATSTVPYTSLQEAGADLLRRYWSWSASDGLDRYTMVEATGLMEHGTLIGIADHVWGPLVTH